MCFSCCDWENPKWTNLIKKVKHKESKIFQGMLVFQFILNPWVGLISGNLTKQGHNVQTCHLLLMNMDIFISTKWVEFFTWNRDLTVSWLIRNLLNRWYAEPQQLTIGLNWILSFWIIMVAYCILDSTVCIQCFWTGITLLISFFSSNSLIFLMSILILFLHFL